MEEITKKLIKYVGKKIALVEYQNGKVCQIMQPRRLKDIAELPFDYIDLTFANGGYGVYANYTDTVEVRNGEDWIISKDSETRIVVMEGELRNENRN